MRAYSVDLRERVVGAVTDGMPQSMAGRTFAVGRATVQRWVYRLRATGDLRPSPVGGAVARIGPTQAPLLRAQVEATPDATLAEHRDRWAADQGMQMSVSGLHRALVRLEITRKKSRSGPASRIP